MNSQTRDLAHLVEGVELKGMAKILTGLTQQFGRELRLHSRLHPTSLLSKSLKDPSIPRARTPLDAPKDAKNRQELEGKQEIMLIFEMKFGIHNHQLLCSIGSPLYIFALEKNESSHYNFHSLLDFY